MGSRWQYGRRPSVVGVRLEGNENPPWLDVPGGKGGCGAHPTRWVGDGHKGEDEMVPGDVG